MLGEGSQERQELAGGARRLALIPLSQTGDRAAHHICDGVRNEYRCAFSQARRPIHRALVIEESQDRARCRLTPAPLDRLRPRAQQLVKAQVREGQSRRRREQIDELREPAEVVVTAGRAKDRICRVLARP